MFVHMFCARYQSDTKLFGRQVFLLAGEPDMSPLRLEAEVNTALNSAYRQVSRSFHLTPDSVGCGASCDSSDILA